MFGVYYLCTLPIEDCKVGVWNMFETYLDFSFRCLCGITVILMGANILIYLWQNWWNEHLPIWSVRHCLIIRTVSAIMCCTQNTFRLAAFDHLMSVTLKGQFPKTRILSVTHLQEPPNFYSFCEYWKQNLWCSKVTKTVCFKIHGLHLFFTFKKVESQMKRYTMHLYTQPFIVWV